MVIYVQIEINLKSWKMISVHGMATKLGKRLSNLTEQPEAEEMYSYGLEIILGGLFEVFILVVLATFFGKAAANHSCCYNQFFISPFVRRSPL